MNPEVFHGTTILSVRKGNRVVIAGDVSAAREKLLMQPLSL